MEEIKTEIEQKQERTNPYNNEMFKDDVKDLEKRKNEIEAKFSETERDDKARRVDLFFKRNNFDAKDINMMYQKMNFKPMLKLRLFLTCAEVLEFENNHADGRYKEKCNEYIDLINPIVDLVSKLINKINRDLFPSSYDFEIEDLLNEYGKIISSFILFILDNTSMFKKYSYESEEEMFDTGV